DPRAPELRLDGLRLSRLRGVGLAASIRLRCVTTNSCGEVVSGQAEIRECTGDFNCSGTLSVQDIFDYLAAYFAGSPGADVNGSGGISVQDIFDYLEAYFVGCGA
ncbi:MAG: GC-type dockerin domain-anchored protein, partial [Phycisphaerales bacterium]